jgi:hypothetical protein
MLSQQMSQTLENNLGYFGDNVKSFPTYQTLSCKSFFYEKNRILGSMAPKNSRLYTKRKKLFWKKVSMNCKP